MPPANFKRKWIKLWIDECLTGTVREDLTPEERSVWYDFLLIAGRNRPPGCISANEDTEISAKRVAAILNIPMSLLARATAKFVESGRITVDSSGIIHITNWDKYQFTDYDRQKPFRQKKVIKDSFAKRTLEGQSVDLEEVAPDEFAIKDYKDKDGNIHTTSGAIKVTGQHPDGTLKLDIRGP